MNRLDGKAALVSGAARGIGAETARLMVEAGASVVLGDVLDERGRETVRALAAAGGRRSTPISTLLTRRIGPQRSQPPPAVLAGSTSLSTTPASFSA
jgi:NAD(P)-dependent dehydrogenase (short-subunit alcohol dehydrogenase family)